MRRSVSAARESLGAESGFTLIEVLVVCALFAVVLIAVMAPLDFVSTQTPKNVEYAHSVADGTTGLQRMLQEIRQAYRVNATNGDPVTGVGSMIDFSAVISGSDREIEYDCSPSTGSRYATTYHRCMRVSAATGSVLPAISSGAVVIDRVINANVFTFLGATGAPSAAYPTYVQANIGVPASGPLSSGLAHTITLNNGTAIPNLQNGG